MSVDRKALATRRRMLKTLGMGAAAALVAPRLARANDPADREYEGVAPGRNPRNPLAVPRDNPPRLVWTGFQAADDGARVFLQTTFPVEYELSAEGRKNSLSVLLRNCRIHLKNNERNLDTRFFGTAVTAVKARQRRKDVEVTITLKDNVAPATRTEEGPDGGQFVVLDFGPGAARES